MKKLLKDNRGEFSLNGALIFALVAFLLVVGLSAIGVGLQRGKLNSMATELARYIDIRGKVDSSVNTELERLEASTGIKADLSIEDVSYLSDSKKTIQFGEPFTVKLTTKTSIGAGGIFTIPFTLHGIGSGRSEQYWKP